MKKQLLLLGILLSLGLFACDVGTSYTVRVQNSTGEELQITYKTLNDRQGKIHKTITLKDDEARVIIRTKDLETVKEGVGKTPKSCEFVAEYMKFIIRDGIESDLKWCDPAIKLETVDIRLVYQ